LSYASKPILIAIVSQAAFLALNAKKRLHCFVRIADSNFYACFCQVNF